MEIVVNITNRVRVKDDCNNWTRSDDLAFDDNPKVLITSPVDESEHEYGEPVIFNAHIQGIPPVLAGLGDYIKWSVSKPGSSDWYGPYEPAPYNYWENQFDSLLPFHPDDWMGTTFEILEFKDCEGLDVLARLDVCSIPADMVTIYVEGTTNTQTIGIIVEDKHQSGSGDYLLVTKTNEEPGAWNNAPIMERDANSLCVLEYAVQLQCNNPCDKPEFIDTKVKAIFDEKPADEITVRLFPVDTKSSRHDFLDELFDNDQEYKYAYYYESNKDVVITAQFGSYDWDAPGKLGPRLSLNNGPTINKDYTIMLSYESQNHYFRNPDLFYLSDPGNTPRINNIPVFRRGLLHGGATTEKEPLPPENYCDFDKEELPCFKSDVVLWGFEPVRVGLTDQSDHATIGVQSKAEVIFVMAHGYQDYSGAPDPPDKPPNFESLTVPEREAYWEEKEDWDEKYAKCVAVGPFYPNNNRIKPADITSNEYLIGVKWFITTACRFLNHSSWQDWQATVQGSPLYAMCGFRGLTGSRDHAYPDDFWYDFSIKLSSGDENNPISIISDYWACPASSDHAVRAWMQNAVEHTRKDAVGKFGSNQTVQLAAAVDDGNGYYIDFITRGWWDPFPPRFRITTY